MNSAPLFIFAGARTPFCRVGSALADLSAADLGRAAATGLLTRTGINPAWIDETIMGCVSQPADAANIARVIALRAGIPKEKPAMTVQRNCASGLEALTTAQERLSAGHGQLFMVGGTESMTHIPLLFAQDAAVKFSSLMKAKSFGARARAMAAFRPRDFMPLMALKLGLTDPVVDLNMGETAEVLAREFGIARDVQDAFAVRSHLLAVRHREDLAEEIVPLYSGGKEVKSVSADNGVRSDSSLPALAKLTPLFDQRHGTVTAGNSSQVSDGAVALLVGAEDMAQKLGLEPLGRLVSYTYTGCDPARMGFGPVTAMHEALKRAAWTLNDADIIEINEAFAAQTLAVLKCLRDKPSAIRAGLKEPLGEIDDAKLNPQGGAIALGHPVGATGARLVLSALMQLRRSGGKRALVSLCIGGGQGGAACLEAL